jgi:hypothetical protein
MSLCPVLMKTHWMIIAISRCVFFRWGYGMQASPLFLNINYHQLPLHLYPKFYAKTDP